MASRMELKQLENLNEKETEILLKKMKFEKITKKMLSGDYGEVTGDILVELDDETLKTEFEVESNLQRKQFLKKLVEYKKDGVPMDLLESPKAPQSKQDVILEKITPQASENKQSTFSNKILKNSSKIEKECTPELDMYAFPAKKTTVSAYKHSSNMNVKRIIIMGETGTGKSTLLNSIVNYAAGVEMEHPFRFKLVTDEADSAADQSKSQTTEISGYLIENTHLGYDIQIWDTPGFADTAGVERDEEIKEQINNLLKIEDECHAICFVVKASANRLTDVQKYIIDRVLLFFGKEARENMYLLATFGDGNRPEMINAIELSNFPFSEDRWFAFNNADLFKPASKRTGFTKMYWDNTFQSIEQFVKKVSRETAFSLATTKAVIEEREKLKMDIKAITNKLDEAVAIKNNGEENLRKLEAEKGQVERTKEFTKNKISHLKKPIPTKNITTFCPVCTETCHEDCSIPNNADKARCWAMTNGNCRICTGKCKWDRHINSPYIYEDETTHQTEIMQDVKKEHDKAMGHLSFYERTKIDLEKEKKAAENNLNILLVGIRSQLDNLGKIAIISNSMDMCSYFMTLMKSEDNKGNKKKALEYEKLAKQEKIQMESGNLTVEKLYDT